MKRAVCFGECCGAVRVSPIGPISAGQGQRRYDTGYQIRSGLRLKRPVFVAAYFDNFSLRALIEGAKK
jgi:hypothetical protein